MVRFVVLYQVTLIFGFVKKIFCLWRADYLQGIADSILYLLLPSETYGCNPVGTLAQDLLVNYVIYPVLNLFSEPDFVNQYIIWLVNTSKLFSEIFSTFSSLGKTNFSFTHVSTFLQCQGFPASSDTFLSVIRTSDNMEEVSAVQDYFMEFHGELVRFLCHDKKLHQIITIVNFICFHHRCRNLPWTGAPMQMIKVLSSLS